MGTELTVIAAVVIGGTRITGGYGTLLGTFLGVALVQLLNNTLVFMGIQSSWNNLFIGAVMIDRTWALRCCNRGTVGSGPHRGYRTA